MAGILQWTNHGGIASVIAIIALVSAMAGTLGKTRPYVLILVSVVLAALAVGAYWPQTNAAACAIYVVAFLIVGVGFPLLLRCVKNAPTSNQCP